MTFENLTNPVKIKPEVSFRTLDTVSNREIDLQKPSEDSIDIYDIAHGLSLICRFGGQITRFYSVAQHSLLVTALAPHNLKKVALLHDASEAFLGDVIKPLKALLGKSYSEIEASFEEVIFHKFGLDFGKLAEVKSYDIQAAWLEDRALRQGKPSMLEQTMKEANMIIAGSSMYYQPIIAKMEFMKAFNQLFHVNQEA
jgi:uncharacterized protein